MENFKIENDITVFCVKARSFPEGVLAAHQQLQKLITFSTDRKYFGISRPDRNGVIEYKAAATELSPGDLSKHNLEKFTIKAGNHHAVTVRDYQKNIEAIRQAFDQILKQRDIDPHGYCLEWYFNDSDVRCMVRKDE